MKILYVTNSRIPTEKAHGIQIMKMCEALGGAGVKVELVVPTRLNPIKTEAFTYYKVKKNFKLKRVLSFDPRPLVYLPQGIYIKAQLSFFLLNLFFYLLFKKDRSDYVFYTREEYLLPLLQWFSNKVVWEGHRLTKNRKRYVRYCQRCLAVVTLTQAMREALVGLGIAPSKIMVAPDAVDLINFDIQVSQAEARRKLELPLDKRLVVYTGHLYQWKGADTALNAAKLLTARPEFLFVFVGGSPFDLPKFQISAQGLTNVLLAGQQPHSIIPYYLKSADVLVLPTSGKNEVGKKYTSPMKLFEYMAAKRPTIASDIPALREILNEKNSILVEADNPEVLAESIIWVFENSETVHKLSEQAFLDVQKYTWAERANKILNFITNQ